VDIFYRHCSPVRNNQISHGSSTVSHISGVYYSNEVKIFGDKRKDDLLLIKKGADLIISSSACMQVY